MTLSLTSLAFAAYYADPLLAKDFDVITRCGHVQVTAASEGEDTPAGWFRRAAGAYALADDRDRLARRALTLVAASFAGGQPS